MTTLTLTYCSRCDVFDRHMTDDCTRLALHWSADLAGLMANNGVHSRLQLAHRLEPLGVARSTVYRGLDDEWRGTPSLILIAAMCRAFGVAPGDVVVAR
ncbi:hypothetical protein BayCH28_22235 [Mycolicibacterium sp. CH28]|uniref:hypothetical protein n=1 Tax=Mycolicibacterium sp. CH28 TaxID=2512237 RepID=UPI00108052C2|nr:hypothetical protein [Mycolicibacterium sp. CH28]TGD85123.1 hypothetical protein BayCH28_22235 [Mycolicibacterium sp. CH28]